MTLDTATFLESDTLAVPDCHCLLFSGWYRTGDISAAPSLWYNEVPGGGTRSAAEIGFNATSDVGAALSNTTGSPKLLFDTSDGQFSTGSYHHVAISGDTNFPAGNKKYQIFFDGVQDNSLTSDTASAFLIYLLGSDFYIPDLAGHPSFDVCDLQWWWNEAFVDLTIPANIAALISASAPVNPATAAAKFGPQTWLFSGNAAAWVSQAAAQSFVITGAITDTTFP